ncbi:hypothetical protein AB3504_19535 [Acinetobacter baumannii]
MSNKITTPFPLFSDIDGSPLNAGFLFLGESGKDAEQFPIVVYWDEAKTQVVSQPVSTRNGFIVRNNFPAKIFIEEESCSITIKNQSGTLIQKVETYDQLSTVKGVKALIETEKQRALLAESTLQTNINNEASRASAAEVVLDTKINSETIRATQAEQVLDNKINANGIGNRAYKTYAEMDADKANIPAKSKVTVTNDSNASNNGDWQWDGTTLTKSDYDPLTQSKIYTKTALTKSLSGKIEVAESSVIYTVDGVSLFGVYHGDFFVADLNVSEGETFLITSTGQGSVRSFYTASSDNVIKSYGEVSIQSQFVTIPANATRLVVNCLKSARNTFSVKLLSKDESIILQKAKDIPDASTLIEKSLSGNIDTVLNKVIYAPDGQTLTPVAHSDFLVADVSVEAGQWYLITSDASGSVRAYYTANGNTVKSYGEVTESLKFVQIPVGANRLIVNSLISNKDKFSVKLLSKDEVALFKSSQVVTTVRDAFPSRPSYPNLLKEKCPKFYEKLKGKTGDLTVCLTGTSLTQGNLYATDRSDATTRPPQLHTNDLASAIFDSLIGYWDGQQYRRYDHSDLTYSSSAWVVTNDVKDGENSVWDDRAEYRNGLTKTTTSANASVAMIYRAMLGSSILFIGLTVKAVIVQYLLQRAIQKLRYSTALHGLKRTALHSAC